MQIYTQNTVNLFTIKIELEEKCKHNNFTVFIVNVQYAYICTYKLK